MARAVSSLIPWRSGEGRLTFLMAANYFLFLLFFYLLKPARDSLFLVNLEPAQLPWVYILTAFMAAPLIGAYVRASDRMNLERLTTLTILVLVISLTMVRLLINLSTGGAVYYIFYGLVAVAGGVSTSQFWLMANAVFDSAQARRLFPVLAMGGIVGAFAGGEITGFLVDHGLVHTQDLILAAIVVLGIAGLITVAIWRYNPQEAERPLESLDEDQKGGTLGVLRSVFGSRHLRLTVIIISLSVMTGSFVDFQFMNLSWQAFDQQAELTSFLGKFYGRVSLVTLLVQMVITPWMLRRLGAGGVLFILPGFLLLGSTFLLVAPGLLAGMLLQGNQMSLKYSLDKTSRELLYMPVPLELKKRTKLFMDNMVDRFARALAGLLLLVCTAIWGADLFHVGIITVVLLILWLIAAYFMRKTYIDSFRQAVARRHIRLTDLRVKVNDSSSVKILIRTLQEGTDREVVFALRMLEGIQDSGLVEVIRPHLQSPSSEVRRLALGFLTANGDETDLPLVEPLLEDPVLEVRVAAIAFMARHRVLDDGPSGCLSEMLAGAAPLRNAALAFLGKEEELTIVHEPWKMVDSRLASRVLNDTSAWAVEGREILAQLPWLPLGCDGELWDQVLTDEEPSVVRSAIKGMGLRVEVDRVECLLKMLSEWPYRSQVRSALAVMANQDPEVLAQLERYLLSSEIPLQIRMEIPRILGKVSSQRSVEILLRHLATHVPEMRFQVLKALNRLRVMNPKLDFDAGVVAREINLEATRFLQLEQIQILLPDKSAAMDLLRRVLRETQQIRLESVFRLMGLLYRAADVAGAHSRLVGRNRLQRGNALEFLDHILSESHRQLLHTLVDKVDLAGTEKALGMDPTLLPGNLSEALGFLSQSCDPWLAACAINAGAEEFNPAADVFLQRKADEVLTPVEKVLILQEVEVFADVPTDLLAALATLTKESHRQAGETLIRENDLPEFMYIIVDGSVKIIKDGQQILTALKGEDVGIWALFNDEPHPVTAVVDQDAFLLRIDQDDFNELMAGDIRVAKSLMMSMSRVLGHFVSAYGWPRELQGSWRDR